MQNTIFTFFTKDKMKNQDSKIRGMLDNQWGPIVRGWALTSSTSDAVWVKVTGDSEIKFVLADDFREDLVKKNLHITGCCGFAIDFGHRLEKPAQVEIMIPAYQLPMSRPSFKNKPLFFMHIAKTAGSSFNHFFLDHYGLDSAVMHIEGVQNWSTLLKHSFISGHVGYQKFQDFFNPDAYLKVTFLRNPIQQIISHFNWVRCISEPENKEFAKTHPQIVLDISKRLCEVDFSDPYSLQTYIESMKPVEISLFDNCQCRYFFQLEKPQSRYTETAYQSSKKNLDLFDYVGLTENFDFHCREICQLAGVIKDWNITEKVNVNKYSYGFDFANDELVSLLEPLIKYDTLLYEYVKSKAS
jgi:hypothetical protein